jgi:hypothetical protein
MHMNKEVESSALLVDWTLLRVLCVLELLT